MAKSKTKSKRVALLVSALSMILCVAMVVGSMLAWFTDTATTKVTNIVSGNLEVELQRKNADGEWVALTNEEDDALQWLAKDKRVQANILWEPGCEYNLEPFRIVNKGNLAISYQVTVSGVTGDATTNPLFNNIVFSVQKGESGAKEPLAAWEDHLLPNATQDSATDAITISGKMKEDAGNDCKNKVLENISITVVATQYTYEQDSNDDQYDAAATYPKAATAQELTAALAAGENVALTDDIEVPSEIIVTKDQAIDLGGNTLSAADGESALTVKDANVTIKNGVITSNGVMSESTVAAFGNSEIVMENCTILADGNKTFAIATNGSGSKGSKMIFKNCTISGSTKDGAKGYAAFIPAGDATFENCKLTGHVTICGGKATFNKCTFTATGFNNQSKIWDKAATASYVKGIPASGAVTMGDCILILDRRAGYSLTEVSITNSTFNFEIPNAGTAYAIKYVDMNKVADANRANITIEGNTYNSQIESQDPTMSIDLDGNDIA